MLEPRFDEHYTPERPNNKGGRNGAKEREKKWAKRFKKERRGALKEMRKDAKHFAGWVFLLLYLNIFNIFFNIFELN
jgi:hypothetical protein